MTEPTNRRRLMAQRWLLVDALTHAMLVAARLQEANDGHANTLLFEDARKAIGELRDNHPAMTALTTAAMKEFRRDRIDR